MPDSIDAERLWQSLMLMAEIGATAGGGCNRQALTDEDRAGRDLLRRWCEEAGCRVDIDAMGNMFARRPGRRNDLPAVATGSHLDTQPSGGRFDGVLGVLAGLEVVRTLNERGIETARPIEVVNWTNEEGSRFGPPTMASAVYAGAMPQEEAYGIRDDQGCTFADALERIGYRGGSPCAPRHWHSFLELHIEQGPVLEISGNTIGVVTAGQGMRWFECRTCGQSSHAGTTPMPLRRDALESAADLVLRIRDTALAHAPNGVATVGQLRVRPGSPNVVPGGVDFTIDLRHPQSTGIESMTRALNTAFKEVAASRAAGAQIEEIFASAPVDFDAGCVDSVRGAAFDFRTKARERAPRLPCTAGRAAARMPESSAGSARAAAVAGGPLAGRLLIASGCEKAWRLSGYRFNSRHRFLGQPDIEGGEVVRHVPAIGCPGQRYHALVPREGEYDLLRGDLVPAGRALHRVVAQHKRVGGEQREALVGDTALGAQGAHIAVPARAGKATVLHRHRFHRAAVEQRLEVRDADVADPDAPRPAALVNRFQG